MKKYIFTETQIKHIINSVIAESSPDKAAKKISTQPSKKTKGTK